MQCVYYIEVLEALLTYTMPLHFHSPLTHLRRALSVPSETAHGHAAQALRPAVVSGFDLDLFFLLVNGGVCVAWGAALTVFATGVVPIYWGISKYGQQHPGLTNVILTGLATLSTTHLKYTVSHATEEYAAMQLSAGLSLPTWSWLQWVAKPEIRPASRRWWAWAGWILLFGGMAGHSASIVAILQPRTMSR
jgi:hypothetical protein